jgi:hypothetical protein
VGRRSDDGGVGQPPETGGRSSPPHAEVKLSELSAVLEKVEQQMAAKLVELQGLQRQRFIDAAAVHVLPSTKASSTVHPRDFYYSPERAYDAAEALWTERQKRIDEQHARGRK